MAGGRPDSNADSGADTGRDARTGGDRRASMRGPSANAVAKGPRVAIKRTRVLQGGWYYMGPSIVFAYAVAMAISWSLPPLLSVLANLVAVGLPMAARRYDHNLEVPLQSWQRRAAIVGVFVVVPMLALGMGAVLWLDSGRLSQSTGVAGMLGLTALGGSYLYRRLTAMFVCQLSIWFPLTIAYGGMGGAVAFAGFAVAAFFVARREGTIATETARRLRREERIRHRAEEILRDYEETGQGWFWETDRRGVLTYISEPVAKMLGYELAALMGRPLTDLFNLEEKQEGERTLSFHLSARSSFAELPVRSAVRDEERWWSVSGRPLYDTFDNFVGFRGSGTDLTEKRRSQEKATRLAQYDSLTGLANRFQMSQTLEKILNAPLDAHRSCSVFLLDLDRFKQVNDTLGHPAGDALLKQVSDRLQGVVGERGRVGRLGGDEFEVIVPGRTERETLAELAGRIIESLSQPYSIDGHRVIIGASVGIAIAPDDGVTSEAVIRNADLALYAAKDGGRGRYHFYAGDLHSQAEERRAMEQDLRDAIQQGQLQLFYQPVVDAVSEEITGFEALMRWQHPTKGWIPPDKFIAIAEDTGLIAPIGEWALREACSQLAQWPDHVRCAVNVSPLQFANPNLPGLLANALGKTGVDPTRLELEITETVFLNDDANTGQMFAALKSLGVRLALDDFGTGYSSMAYLKKAPFDKIKIDRGFVQGATEPGSRNGAIIASITSLAQALGMDTTAEGVETMDELELVRMLGCSHIQGYIYDRPLSAQAAGERLADGARAEARGPRSARAARQAMLRQVTMEHEGQYYPATIRNISVSGLMVEGLWNVPPGTIFTIHLTSKDSMTATARWCAEGRTGLEFSRGLDRDHSGKIILPVEPAKPATGMMDEPARRAG